MTALRRSLGATVLIGQPLLLLGGQAMRPADSRDGATLLSLIADDPARWYTATMLLGIGAFLLVPVLAVLNRYATVRGSVLTTFGAVLAGAAVTMAGIAFTMEAPVLAVASRSSLDRSAMASFIEALIRDPHAAWAYNFTPLLLAGIVLLTIGLIRARQLPWWLPLLYAVGLVLSFAPAPNPAIGVLLGIPWIAGSWLIAAHLARRHPSSFPTPELVLTPTGR